MASPRAPLPTLRSYLGQIALQRTTSTTAVRGLRKLSGGLTEGDEDVRDVINAVIDELDATPRVISVKAYGATGDGTTNDLVAIQSAIDELGDGDVLYFPAGTYLLNWLSGSLVGNLRITGLTGITIKGDGPGASVIHDARSASNDYNGESYGGNVDATPSFGANDSAGVLSIFDCEDVTIRDLKITSTATGTETTTLLARKAIYPPRITGSLRVHDCAFEGLRGEVVYVASVDPVDVWVERCTITGCPSNGVNLGSDSMLSRYFINDNVLDNCRAVSPILISVGNAKVSGNTLRNTLAAHAGDKIVIDNCEKFEVTRNTISGISANPDTDASVIRVWYSATVATRCDGLIAHNLIADNELGTSSGNGAILLGKAPAGQVLVTGNVVVGNGYGGGSAVGLAVKDGGDAGAFTQGCAYLIEGNVFGAGGRNQNTGIHIHSSAYAYDIRIGDNVFDCTTPVDYITPSNLGMGSYRLAAERVAAKAFWSGVSLAFAASRVAKVTTTDATVTTAQSYTPPTNSIVDVVATVVAVNEDASEVWRATLDATFSVQGGVVTQVGTTNLLNARTNGSVTTTATIDTASNVIRVRVTGEGGTEWYWAVETGITVREVD